MNKAFTLAEVLVTLGIIGIISALTIPTLVNNYQKKVATTAAKKAYSTLSQAYTFVLNNNEDGVLACETNNSRCLADLFAPILKSVKGKLWVPNSGIAEGCWEDNDIDMPNETHYCFSSIDGISYDFDMEFQLENSRQAIIYIDINGPKKPNRFGRDRFVFQIIGSKLLPAKQVSINSLIDYNNATYVECSDGKILSNGLSFPYNYGCAYKYIYKQ